jgi:hypothetical protein
MNTRKYLWLIFGIIGALINLTNADSNYIDSQPLGMALSGFFLGALLGFIVSLIIDAIGNSKTINENVSAYKEKKKYKENHIKSMTEYNEAKESFQYLSNETLLTKYDNYLKNNINDMTRLALEEELVKRNVIEYSPMHEKMENIKNNFKI